MGLTINGQYIDDAALEAEFSGIKAYHEQMGNVSCCERNDEFRAMARKNILARVLLVQAALAQTTEPTEAELDAAFEDLARQHGGRERMLLGMGATEENIPDIRAELSVNLRVERLVEGRCANDPTPTEAELWGAYEANLAKYMTAEEVRTSHISRSPPRVEQRQKVYDELRQVRQKLMEGADFDELARAHSERGKEQIDLGFIKRGELPEEFELVAFSMRPGEISPVFSSQVGYHLIKVTDHKPSVPIPFEQCREQVLRQVLDERRNVHIRALVDELEQSAQVEEVAEPV